MEPLKQRHWQRARSSNVVAAIRSRRTRWNIRQMLWMRTRPSGLLNRLRRLRSTIDYCRFSRWLEQLGLFEQAAEIFFAGDVPRAFLVAGVGHGLVFHFEPFEAHDADVFLALFPNLALAQFHGRHWKDRNRKNLPLLIFASGETVNSRLLFLFLGDRLFGRGLFGFGFC